MSRHRRWAAVAGTAGRGLSWRTWFVVCTAVALSANAPVVAAPPTGPTTPSPRSPVAQTTAVQTTAARNASAAERQRQYDELSREAAEVERFAGVIKKVVKLVKPAVVHIEADKETTSELGRRHVEEAGSGVIVQIGDRFYAVTNRHVIKDAENHQIKIRLADGRELRPQRSWADEDTDLAVMAITANDLVPARLGDSDKLDIGDFVLAVGSPFGLSHSVTFGMVSAKDRRNLSLGDGGLRYQDFIQTDASINPGNSGGPLVNLRGEVIGICTAIATNSGKNEGIGFAIPSSMVTVVVRQLVEKGTVQRAFLGVSLDVNFGPAMAARLGLPRPQGALVTSVEPKSPAEEAQLRSGDVILSFNGKAIEDDNHLINLVSLTPIGSDVSVVVYRAAKEVTVRVKVGDAANSEWAKRRRGK